MKIPEDKVHYVDLPDLSETFSDYLRFIMFDGQTARIELCVTRMDEPNPPKPITAKRYPSCRLVLTPETAFDLANKLQGIIKAMQEQGALKKIEPEKGTIH